VEVLAWLSHYELADGEWDAILSGVEQSDSDASSPQWYNYEFQGKHKVTFNVGWDHGTEVIQVRIKLPDAIAARVETALNLMNQYTFGKAT
jgi:hypothetical protein